ncbi:class I SAM-dependent methyltransferase [Saccharothrix sp. ALI-22-I]|uniref:class I SAM-dependent methyltransferase n=1 Tax=Saccharothrix sp. ALI-22-I TaxID=1933778 RepID=UPI0009FC9633|nr:methyltransferase domain-containing protein [Saccharothrix sp. ALI-22-I]
MTKSRDTTEAAFNKRAASYDSNSWHIGYARRLVELVAPTPGIRILDAATGTGFAAIAAARATGPAGRVVGVDISAGMLDRARQSITAAGLTNIDLVQADATSLPHFADASFDLVLCSAGLLYLPVQAALREWHRLLAPGGLIAFSTMREGFPVGARLFREQARRYGLDLTDPATPLGTESRCAHALREAGITPTAPVAETVQFSRGDLEHAWEAHVHGPHHDAIATLVPEQVQAFQHDYTSALADLLRDDEDRLLNPEVIYAFGRKPSPPTAAEPAPTDPTEPTGADPFQQF